MASLFQRANSSIWKATIKVWDAKKSKWVWRQISTGTSDRIRAAAIAANLEEASGATKGGAMTKEKAMRLVDDIVTLAGSKPLTKAPSLREVWYSLIDNVKVSSGTERKYWSHWNSLEEWAGDDTELPIDRWSTEQMTKYYRHLKGIHSITTANDHMAGCARIFGRAVKQGHITLNPVAAVDLDPGDSAEKAPITRDQMAKLYRAMRKEGREDWITLAGLGWNTGHRIQDLLRLDVSSIDGDTVSFQPQKKARRGGKAVVLPVPRWLVLKLRRLGNLQSIHKADNRNGRVSAEFATWLRMAGIDTQPLKRGKRTINLVSFHSFRHAMQTRLTAAGVSGELARLVTDHDSPKVARGYTHSQVQALREALALARRR